MQSAEHMSCLTAAVHVALGRLCHAVKEACLDPGLESEKERICNSKHTYELMRDLRKSQLNLEGTNYFATSG